MAAKTLESWLPRGFSEEGQERSAGLQSLLQIPYSSGKRVPCRRWWENPGMDPPPSDGRKDHEVGRRLQWPSSACSDVTLSQLQSCAMLLPAPHCHLPLPSPTWNSGHASQLFVNSVTPLAKAERQAQCVCNYWKTKNLETGIFRKSKLTSFCACVCTHAVQSMSAQCTCM